MPTSRTLSTADAEPRGVPASQPSSRPAHPPVRSTGRRGRRLRSRLLVPYVCLLPTTLLILAVLLVPVAKTFVSAFSAFNELGQPVGWTGFDNFRFLFADPVFPQIVRQTVIWTVVITVVATPVSVGLALVLNHRFPGRAIARAVIFAPWAVSFVYVAIVWKFIFDPFYGQFNALLESFGLHVAGTPWLGRPDTAFGAVIWVGIQLTIPFTTVVTLAALQSVPEDVIEAARIDGAGGWKLVRHIVLPLIQPVLVVATLVNIIYIFNSFPVIWVMTGGGPVNSTDTIVTYLYKVAFNNNQYGEGAALSVISFAVLMGFSLVYVKFAGREQF
jgi:multiple sugar transport system permease protein